MKSVLFDYVSSNKKNFMLIFGTFLIGIILGIIFINHTSNNEISQITNYIVTLKENIQAGESIDKFSCFLDSLKQNFVLVFLIWLLGSSIVGGILIYVIIAYKGFSVGYTISALIASLGIKGGSIFVFSSLLPQNIILLPVIFILAESGLKVYTRIMKSNVDIKKELFRYTIIMLIALFISAISSTVEAYLSTNLLLFFKNFI